MNYKNGVRIEQQLSQLVSIILNIVIKLANTHTHLSLCIKFFSDLNVVYFILNILVQLCVLFCT